MAVQIVIGKGPVGVATADLLAERGHQVRVISRTGGASAGSIEHVALDVTADPGRLAELSGGAAAIYSCAAPPYHRWVPDWPPLAAAMLDAAEKSGAVLVLTNNLYAYGPVDGAMTEDLPLAARTRKGRVRARVWEDAVSRHEAGRVRVAEARAADFVGPGVTANGHLAQRVVPQLLRGRPASVLGDPDALHSWTFVPDVARTLACLADDERAWGKAWHVPTAEPYSTRTAVGRMCRIAGVEPVRVTTTPWWLLSALGLFAPKLRELGEIRYQFDRPFIVDSSRYTSTFGQDATPAEEALAATVQWWQRKLTV
jgi:nucleoside-diphosphate-sugar epimerase